MATDLSSLMQVAPLNASYMIGQNNAQDQQTTALRQQELQQIMQLKAAQEARAQQEQPFTLDRLGLANESTRAQLPGLQATSRKLGVDANIAEQTQQSSIDEKNFKNNNEMFTKTAQQLDAMVGDISKLDDIQKPLAVKQAIDSMGLPPAAAARLWQKVGTLPPSQMAARIKEISDAMLRANPEYAKDIDKTGLETSERIVTNAASNASHERIAATQAAARAAQVSAAKRTIDEQINAAKTPIEKAEKAEQAYMMFKDIDPDKAAEYLAIYNAARARAAEDARNHGLAQPRLDTPATAAGGIPVNTPQPSANVPAAGSAVAPASAAQVAPPKMVVPPTGTVKGGYRFKGGNPADKNNWEKV